LKLLDFLLPAY